MHFVPTLGAVLLHSLALLILYSAFFCGPFHPSSVVLSTKRHFWVCWLFLFLDVSWRTKLQRLSLGSQYILGQTVSGSVIGSASFQHGDIFNQEEICLLADVRFSRIPQADDSVVLHFPCCAKLLGKALPCSQRAQCWSCFSSKSCLFSKLIITL